MSHTQTYISSSTGKPVSVSPLMQQDKAAFYTLMGRAEIAAREYDGSSAQRIKFLTVAQDIRRFAQQCTNLPLNDAIDALAQQARPRDLATFSLEGLYQKARMRVRGDTGQESNFGALLKTARIYGPKQKVTDEFPVTGDKDVNPSGAFYQPKFGAIIDELGEHGIMLDDIYLTTGPYAVPRNLRDSYIVLTIRKPALQIAVCDNDSVPTYFSRDIEDPKFWEHEDTRQVNSRDLEILVQSLRNHLPARQPERTLQRPSRPTAEPVQKPAPRPYTRRAPVDTGVIIPVFTASAAPVQSGDPICRKIFADVLRYGSEKNRFPSIHDPEMKSDMLQTWLRHDSWLMEHKNQSLSLFIKTSAREEAARYAELHQGALPDEKSGLLPGYPNYSFGLLDRCFRAYPAKPTLQQIINTTPQQPTPPAIAIQEPLSVITPPPQPSFAISAAPAVERDVMSTAEEVILTEAGKLKVALDYLSEERKFIFKLPDGTSGAPFMQEWIISKVLEHRADHEGQNPTRESGYLKDSVIDWAMIEDAIYNRGRHYKINLEQFIEKNVPRPREMRRTRENILTL